jgi:type II secretory pathway pseudopilin PulG
MNQAQHRKLNPAVVFVRDASPGRHRVLANLNSNQSGSGFTLLEMIGVLAVIALISALMAPVVVQSLDQAVRTRDTSELSSMASALQSAIRRHGQIPDEAGMPAFIAAEMGVSANQVSLNPRNNPRLLVVDPALAIAGGGLPYTQGVYGATNTFPRTNLRLLIFSSLNLALPSRGTFDFNTAWSTPDKTKPADWTTWQGAGEDLIIQRVDFTPAFHRVILNHIAAVAPNPRFSIESGGVASSIRQVRNILDSWYIESTVLCLYDTNSVLRMKGVIQADTSFVFQDSSWSGSLK